MYQVDRYSRTVPVQGSRDEGWRMVGAQERDGGTRGTRRLTKSRCHQADCDRRPDFVLLLGTYRLNWYLPNTRVDGCRRSLVLEGG